MSYYRPKWLSYVAIFLSVINAFAFPIYGLIYAKLLFVLMRFKDPTADYFGDRDFWCGMFLLECFGIGIVSFFHQYIFSYMGENLTFDVRNELFAGIIYK